MKLNSTVNKPIFGGPHIPCFETLTALGDAYADQVKVIYFVCDAVASKQKRCPSKTEVANCMNLIYGDDRKWVYNMTTIYNAWCRQNGVTMEERDSINKTRSW